MSSTIPPPTIPYTPYTSRGTGTRTLELLEVAANYNRWIVQRLEPGIGQRVLEVGCGMGAITRLLAGRELVVGIDVIEEFIEHLNATFCDGQSVEFLHCDVGRDTDALRKYRFDSAVSVNVFEHIEDDVAAMEGVHGLLEPGGTFALLVPAHPWLYGDFDRSLGHHRRYTRTELSEKLRAAGFEIDRIYYSNPVGALGWLVNVRLLRRAQLGGVGLYERLVPLLAVLDRLVCWPVGLQLIAVARRPR